MTESKENEDLDQDQENFSKRYLNLLKKYFRQMDYVVGFKVALLGVGAYAIYQAGQDSQVEKYGPPQIIHQESILGTPEPEIYVELNGVKYFSHIDGKDITDLLK